jgi:alanyl-tRNA synthetase
MTGNEIREKFLAYFESKGHHRVRSSPLLPANDPTLLFTNAGMNQFKDVFLGAEKRDYLCAVSSQKCLRAGGKHNDLDEVGKTARHQTFFEMLGNFSFGDYFKEDAILFAWDLLVNEFKLDPARLWFSVFGGDDEVPADEEAERLWEKVGAPKERILRFGRKDNFWQMGETGPCGPCSEVHYYMGPDPSDPENCAANVNGAADTITEIWNLVFMQYNRTEFFDFQFESGRKTTVQKGAYRLNSLPAPSVDTGMGLERITAVLQGETSNYGTDLLRDIVKFIAKLANQRYEADTQTGFAMRVIADHARATAFSIADGIQPSNEGRNYVIRKIMRRAIYQGRHTLGFDEFFHKVTNFVVDQMHQAYPELEASRESIRKIVRIEEERFGNTLTLGLKKLEELLERYVIQVHMGGPADVQAGWVPAVELAKLYDTFGIPIDLMYVVIQEDRRGRSEYCQEQRWEISTFEGRREITKLTANEFNEIIEVELGRLQQQSTKRIETKRSAKPVYVALTRRRDSKSTFKGYNKTRVENAKVLYLIKGDHEVDSLGEGDEGEVLLDQTPFYAESGGQVGDVGRIIEPSHAIGLPPLIATVTDTYTPAQGLIVHKVKVDKGTLTVTDLVTAEIDEEKRNATRRNHTATHLVHAALREVLGGHVKQSGSVVAPSFLRFDFTHFQPLTQEEILDVERLVNEQILKNVKVDTKTMPVEEAIRSGAMALFGEKYSGMMRVLTVPGFSKELCGGTHVRATGDIGVFKITSDESIASGVRRIRALTGIDAYERFREDELLIDRIANNLRTSRLDLTSVVGKLQDELKKARREADELRLKIASGAVSSAGSNGDEAREIAGVRIVAREASGLDAPAMRQLSDTLLARLKSGVVVLGRSGDGKASIIVRTSSDLATKVPAGQVIRELAPIIGGKGGGKPDMAEGGGNQPEKLSEALDASYAVIEKLLTK